MSTKVKKTTKMLNKLTVPLQKLLRPFGLRSPVPSGPISTSDKIGTGTAKAPLGSPKPSAKAPQNTLTCPACLSQNFVRRGFRKKKREKIQLYQCKDCQKTFTHQLTHGKHYPLPAMLEALSLYHLGHSCASACRILNQKLDYNIHPTSVSNWITEFQDICRFSRLRPYALKRYHPKYFTVTATLAHRQLYRYRFHRAKCNLIIREDIKHRNFGPLEEFLEMVPSETPHQYFQDGLRASESPLVFSKTQMIVRPKHNLANQLAEFVLQSVKERKARHDAIQKFMLYNDSVTVATEVPVYITKDDLLHLQTQLGFEMGTAAKGRSKIGTGTPKLITGHIDILQIRNGQVHILDYKPNAAKEKPIEQLTLYAMALSRLTGLRMYEFKCAWFDEKDYFEFYPLHVVHKPKGRRRRKNVYTKSGTFAINQDPKKLVVSIAK
ncbi:PD-(D/E)XK nuclease family protein [Patescibacteria group bacterium]|nr:PD-(D/E)XK nuclease family protein [Patescibacteria group bacterium]